MKVESLFVGVDGQRVTSPKIGRSQYNHLFKDQKGKREGRIKDWKQTTKNMKPWLGENLFLFILGLLSFLTMVSFFKLAFPAETPDMTVFSITIGKPLEVPLCPKGTVVFETMCYMEEPYLKKDKYGLEHITVWLPTSQEVQNYNEGFLGGRLYAVLIDGSLEAVTVETRSGSWAQETILNLLSKKYGKSSSLQKRLLQNAFGAKFIGYLAIWRLTGLTVKFESDELNGGSVEIQTTRYASTMDAVEKDQKKNAVKF
jgi:hypothetical protein